MATSNWETDSRFIMDPSQDSRNVIDDFKGMNDDIIKWEQDSRRNEAVAVALNLTHDFNKGSVLRAASTFAFKKFLFFNKPNNQHPENREGTKHWDRRGAVGTMNYNTVEHYSVDLWREILAQYKTEGYKIFAVDNTVGYNPKSITRADMPSKSLFIFGEEGPGIPHEILDSDLIDEMIYIPQLGVSPRSLNVAQAAACVMMAYADKNDLI